MSEPPVPPDRGPEPAPRPDQPIEPGPPEGSSGYGPGATAHPPPGPGQPGPFAVPAHQPPAYGQLPGYGPPRPSALGRTVIAGGWIVLVLHALTAVYVIAEENAGSLGGPDTSDRLFAAMPVLGQGIFYAGLLLAAGKWLESRP